ncbi:sensor domain-containing diguanylate cyclase [Fusibacter ferrireducens]|uniref:Diguanylate cyclase n=1 Tax=Fusibacter ferrireducens TaxID=2785058 RepID=A0ABR9ZZ49_9FIRM|nr:diguanylate cyclase [Fusibacter ferrireducens]MBF4695732.1 diguanylate cyclase [Fusibacter ferrireducens]
MKQPIKPQIDQNAFDVISRKKIFKFSLAVIGLVLFLNVLLMIHSVEEQEKIGHLITAINNQRMLSQRIIKSVLGFEQAESLSQKELYYKEIEFSLRQLSTTQEQLVANDFLFQFEDTSSGKLLDSAMPYYGEILRITGKIIDEKALLLFDERNKLSLNGDYYLRFMDELLAQLSHYLKHFNQNMVRYEIGTAILIVILIVSEYFFVYIPADRRTEESISETKNLFDIAPTAIVIVDPKDFTIQEINDAGEALLQLNYDEALRMNLQDFIPEETKNQIQHFSEKEHEHIIKGIEANIRDLKRNEIVCLISVGKFNFGGKEHLLIGLADITAQKQSEEVFEKLATIDEMTGLYNRRTGLVMLGKEFEKAKRHIYDVTVCFIDMDGLKHVNDTFGHSEGDWYIRSITTIIREGIRQGDIGMRFGGDEIVLGLTNCDEVEAEHIMNRIQTVLDLIIEKENKPYEMGISYGLSEYKKDVPVSLEAFINYADERMYAVKTLKKTTRR